MATGEALTTLEATLQHRVSGDTLLFTPGVCDCALLEAFLSTLPSQSLALHTPQLVQQQTPPGLVVTGTIADVWPVRGLGGDGLAMSNVRLTFTQAHPDAPLAVQLLADGTLTVGGKVIAVRGQLLDDTTLHFTLAQDNTVAVSLLDMAHVASNGGMQDYIPAGVALFESLTLTGLELAFGYLPTASTLFSVTADTRADWAIIDGLAPLRQVGVTLSTTYAYAPQVKRFRSSFGGNLHATLHIGQDFDVRLGFSNTNVWEIAVLPQDGNLLPGLADLAGLAGGAALQSSVQRDLQAVNLGDISIAAVRVGFDLAAKKLAYVLISGHLTLAAKTINLQVQLPDFQFAGSLARETPISVKELVAHFFAASDAFPDIEITQLTLQATPSQGAYALSATIEGQLLDLGPFKLDQVWFAIEKSAAGFSGAISAVCEIAGAGIFVSAAHTGQETTWQFSGRTVPGARLPIGHLLDDITRKFGVAQLPEALAELALDDLAVNFTTRGNVDFTCTGSFPLAEQQITATVTLRVQPTASSNTAAASYTVEATGTLHIGTATFQVDFDSTPEAKKLAASWKDPANPLSVAAIAQAFGLDVSDVPAELLPALTEASFSYDFTARKLVLTVATEHVKLVFVTKPSQAASRRIYGVGLGIAATVRLTDLPLIGERLATVAPLGIDGLQLLVLSGLSAQDSLADLNAEIPTDPPGLPTFPTQAGLSNGAMLHIPLQMGSTTQTLTLQLGGAPPASSTLGQPPATPSAGTPGALTPAGVPSAPDNTKWVNLQKSFGPISFKRIGVKYQDGQLTFLLDAALSAAGLSISLQGLSISSPLQDFRPTFHLDGLGVDFAEGPLEIAGAFLGVPPAGDVSLQYDGAIIVKAEDFGLMGVGSYAVLRGGQGPSLFAFVQLDVPLGGPAFFFVTGLSGGFGYNRTLRLPTQDEVMNFPLVKGLDQPVVAGSTTPDPLQVLAVLEGRAAGPGGQAAKPWITTQVGQDWIAAGLQFTSFDIVKSHALLIVEFGNTFELALLGLAVARLPQEGPQAYAYVELALEVIVDPAAGVFSATAGLTSNSYVLDRNGHLTGGFAFYVWFSGPHAGDFVLTVGGYHPRFAVPAWYPLVPRLGLNWAVSDVVSIKGEVYFALTPSNVMAGGALELLLHAGDLRAWFKAYLDMIIGWKPFHYEVSMGLSIGVSYHTLLGTLQVELGVTADMWGPPMGGQAHINWSIIAFTIAFGAARTAPQAIGWDEFRTLLPAPAAPTAGGAGEPAVCQVRITDGLLRQVTTPEGAPQWIVRADSFAFATETTIPATTVELMRPSLPALEVPAAQGIGIRPMGLAHLTSTHKVSITHLDTQQIEDLTGWAYRPSTRNVPEALWGTPVPPGQRPAPTAQVLPDRLVGLQDLRLQEQEPHGTPPIPLLRAFSHDRLNPNALDGLPLSPTAVGEAPPVPQSAEATQESAVVALRSEMAGVLQSFGLATWAAATPSATVAAV